MSKTRYKKLPEEKILRSCYFQSEVLNNASLKLKDSKITLSSFANYCMKLCLKDESLLNRVEALYMLDRSFQIITEFKSRKLKHLAEKKMIKSMLKLCKGNKTLTAKNLKMARGTLIKKMDQYDIKRNKYSVRYKHEIL